MDASPILDSATPLIERVRALQERRADAFLASARRVRRRADDEAIHDLRVATRRLLAILDLWDRALPSSAWRRARRELKDLRRRAGRAREYEVFFAALTERLPRLDDETRAAVAALLRRIESRLDRHREQLARRVRPKRLGRKLRELRPPDETIAPPAIARALQRERRLEDAAREAISTALASPEDQALHQARIAVKKWRYVAESLGEAGVGLAPRPLEALRGLQESLGAAQDRATLRDEIGRWARRPSRAAAAAALGPLLEALEDERHLAVNEFRRRAADLPPAQRRRAARGGVRPAPDSAPTTWESSERERLERWLMGAGGRPREAGDGE